MKRSTLFAIIILVLAAISVGISLSNYVLIALITSAATGVLAILNLLFMYKNKLARYLSLLSVVLSFFALLQFFIANESYLIKDVKVKKGESETDKRFEEELNEDGFELEDDEEPI